MHSMLILKVIGFYFWVKKHGGIEADNEIQFCLFPERLIIRTPKDQTHQTHKPMYVILCLLFFFVISNVLTRFVNVFRKPHM